MPIRRARRRLTARRAQGPLPAGVSEATARKILGLHLKGKTLKQARPGAHSTSAAARSPLTAVTRIHPAP